MHKRRLFIKKLHLYVALLSALPLLVMCLSGTMLVYKEAIDEYVTRDYIHSPVGPEKKSILELRDTLKAQFPKYEFSGVVLPPKEGRSYYYWIKDAPLWTVLYIDPYTAQFRGERAWEDWTVSNLIWWLTDLHYSFKWGKPGSYVVGVCSLIMCFSVISGLFLWWPRRSKFDVMKFKPRLGKRWRQTAFNLHSVIGFYASVALLVIGLTGTFITFFEPLQKLVHAVTFSPPPVVAPIVPPLADVPFKTPEEIIAVARTHLREKHNVEPHVEAVVFPTKENSVVEISFQGNPGLAWADHSHVWVNAQTGELVGAQPAVAFNRGESVAMWMGPIHFGTWGAYWGPAWEQVTRILWIFVAITPVFLIISGFSIVRKSFWKKGR